MNIEQLRVSGRIMLETVTGSHAYGLALPTSDLDIRGIFWQSRDELLRLCPLPAEVSDDKQDVKFYSLRKFFELAADCNPNIIELLFMPEDCMRVVSPEMRMLIGNRKVFVSRKAAHTFGGYAHAQIKKAKGQNKWVNNPQPESPPKRSSTAGFSRPVRSISGGCPRDSCQHGPLPS